MVGGLEEYCDFLDKTPLRLSGKPPYSSYLIGSVMRLQRGPYPFIRSVGWDKVPLRYKSDRAVTPKSKFVEDVRLCDSPAMLRANLNHQTCISTMKNDHKPFSLCFSNRDKRKRLTLLEKPRLFGNLMSQVIRQDRCSFCGACMAACPINILWPVGEQPTMVGTCALCEICYYQCPNVEFSSEDVETFLHGRIRRVDETVGIYRQAFVGRASNSDIKNEAQDGGVVTALLAYALEKKIIDAAVVAGRDEKWVARPKVATKYDDLVRNAGTKYTPSPTLLGVKSAIDEYGRSRVGLVGTPCQIRAVRRIQTLPMGNRRLAEAITVSIGLFCMESYKHDSLIENYLISKGIDPSKLTRMRIKKGQFIATSGGTEMLRVPLREINQYVRGSCHRCDDFTAEYADISVGGIGCPDGYSTVVARTQNGIALVMEASRAGFIELRELKQEDKGFQAVLKMSGIKKTKNSA